MVTVTEFDDSKPLATLLREGTAQAHTEVETSEGAKLLLSGGLAKSEYIKFLMMLWHVYDTLEKALEKHASHPCLEHNYNPTLLARAPSLSADIAHLLEVDEPSWQKHKAYTSFISPMPEPLADYVSRIQYLSEEAKDPSPLLAHAYVRYLGDLSGGQSIRRIIAKAYNLDESAGLGLSFYNFKELKTSKPAGLGEMKRIKEWYREGMNRAGEVAQDRKTDIVEEASIAFRLNSGLFQTLQLIGLEEEERQSASKKAESGESTVIYDGSKQPETTYSLSSVIAVVTAVCIAHFFLVVGGFTGNAGYEKLLALEEWFASVFSKAPSSA